MMRTLATRRCGFSGPARARGLAVVEFTIAASVLILLMLAVAEFGRAWVQYDTLSYAVRSSARYVSEHAISGTSGVVDITDQVAERARNLAVYGTITPSATPLLPGLDVAQVTVSSVGDDNIQVTAQYPYQPLVADVLPLLEGGDSLWFKLRVSIVMRAIS